MCATQSMVVPSQAAGPMVLTANRSILRGVPACPTSIVAKGQRTVTRMSPSPLSNSNIAPPQIAQSLPVAAIALTSPSPLPQPTSASLRLPVGTAPLVATPVVTAPGAAPAPTPSPTTSPPNLPIGPGLNGTKPFGVPAVSSLPNMSDASTSEKELGNESPPKAPKGDQPIVSSSPLSHTSRANNNSIGLSSGGLSPSASRHGTGTTPQASQHSHSRTPSRQGHARQPSAIAWHPFERMLFETTDGVYNPTEMAQKRRVPMNFSIGTGTTAVMCEIPGRVSIVAPSMASRQHYHENLYRCFEAQDYLDKELIVVETYEDKPSSYLQKVAKDDERVVHVAIKVSPGKDFTVGLKRNMTLHLASGEYIVNFDDDDLYAPGYVPRVVQLMRGRNLVGLTLSAWYNYYIGIQTAILLRILRAGKNGRTISRSWMRSCTAMVSATLTGELCPYFFAIPMWALLKMLPSFSSCEICSARTRSNSTRMGGPVHACDAPCKHRPSVGKPHRPGGTGDRKAEGDGTEPLPGDDRQ
ncbi:Uncharacterized protein SCF082_LOCUS41630 [Durusdinium trenchii]|uniref:Glycosyltransferase 2-like domain-containing protein n=1 Tax=Durusdinium trenchii TaxID=1381693 RepID=A0ABP0QJZ0_9DINO